MNPATDYDLGLVRTVYREQTAVGVIRANLTRWGFLNVTVAKDPDDFPLWQGDNILEARAWAEKQKQAA
jgi:hypothetical protein